MGNDTKVTHIMLGGALATLIVILGKPLLRSWLGGEPPDGLESALAVVMAALVGWLMPRARGPSGGAVGLLCLLLASPASASPARITIEEQEAKDATGKAMGRTEDAVWLDLSFSLDFFQIDLASREYKAGVSPGVGYGVKFSPAWWTLSPVFLALDLFVQASLADDLPEAGPDHFNIDVVPAIVVGDWVGVGLGPRFLVGLRPGMGTRVHPQFSFGLRKAL